MATNFMVGRCTASAIASASRKSHGLIAIHARQLDFRQDEVRSLFCHRCKRVLAILCLGDFVMGAGEHIANDPSRRLPHIEATGSPGPVSASLPITANTILFVEVRAEGQAIVARFMSVTELAYAPTHRVRQCTEPAPRIQRHSTLHQSCFPSTKSRLRIQRRTNKYFFNNQMMRIAEDCSLNSECYRRQRSK